MHTRTRTHTSTRTNATARCLEDTAGDPEGRTRIKRGLQPVINTHTVKEHCGHWHSWACAYVYHLHVAGSKSALVCVYAWPMPGRCAHTLRSDTSLHLYMAVSSSDRPRASFVPPHEDSFRKPGASRTPSWTNAEEEGDSDQQ